MSRACPDLTQLPDAVPSGSSAAHPLSPSFPIPPGAAAAVPMVSPCRPSSGRIRRRRTCSPGCRDARKRYPSWNRCSAADYPASVRFYALSSGSSFLHLLQYANIFADATISTSWRYSNPTCLPCQWPFGQIVNGHLGRLIYTSNP